MPHRTIVFLLLFFTIGLLFSSTLAAKDYFQVTLLRAAPSHLPQLIERVKKRKVALSGEMVIMRHSQGDHWDLMLLTPIQKVFPEQYNYQSHVDYQHDFIASAEESWKVIKQRSVGANLFHIEMFQAAKGLYQELLKQRHMENQYLVSTKRAANLIFETQFGSDVDLFTLGIYKDLPSFAAEPALAPDVFEKAATDAGFKSRSDIGFYLRRFLVGHQDTLATQVR